MFIIIELPSPSEMDYPYDLCVLYWNYLCFVCLLITSNSGTCELNWIGYPFSLGLIIWFCGSFMNGNYYCFWSAYYFDNKPILVVFHFPSLGSMGVWWLDRKCHPVGKNGEYCSSGGLICLRHSIRLNSWKRITLSQEIKSSGHNFGSVLLE